MRVSAAGTRGLLIWETGAALSPILRKPPLIRGSPTWVEEVCWTILDLTVSVLWRVITRTLGRRSECLLPELGTP